MMERRLGRGLGSLLGQSEAIDARKDTPELPVDKIRPNPHQPRKHFDDAALADLAQSLRTHGLLQPVVVRPSVPGFELISGERRWRAARIAGFATIPAIIRSGVADQEMLELALVENLQREDLDAMERARGFRSMMESLGITQEDVAKKVGLQRASVANHLRLLELPGQVQEAVSKGLLAMGHAKAILALSSPLEQIEVMERAVREGLSVRQLETLGRERSSTSKTHRPQTGKAIIPHQPWIAEIESRIRDSLGTKISVQNSRGYRGRIVIEYYDRATLERLFQVLLPSQRLE
jgi:ParB family chromosome partitioning protein